MRPAVLDRVRCSSQAKWSKSGTNALPFKQRKLKRSVKRARPDQQQPDKKVKAWHGQES